MDELVSILIPAYNAEKWIGDTIKSALNQTWLNREIIIVNDGSTDNTLQIARRFESKAVKVVTQENRGASAARNRALTLAQGDYIQWLDADDLLAPHKISRQLNDSDKGWDSRILFSSAWGKFYLRPQKARFITNSLWKDLSPIEWILTRFTDSVWMHPASWLVSRKLTELAGLWNEQLSFDDDGEYFTRVVSVSEKVRFVPEAKCYYRIGNSGSLSEIRSEKALQSSIMSIRLCINHLRLLEDSEKTRAACLKFLENRLWDFYPENYGIVEKSNDIARELGGNILAPKENWKFFLSRKITGFKMALNLKNIVWRAELFARKHWENLS